MTYKYPPMSSHSTLDHPTFDHPTWLLSLEGNAGLILTPCPGTKSVSLTDAIEQLKTQGATIVISAIEQAEMQRAGVDSLGLEVQKAGLKWFHAPIEDDCAPDNAFLKKWQQLSPELHAAIIKGEKIALHCMGGSGRTGLLAAHFLHESGWSLEKIIEAVKVLRPSAFTKSVQIDYVKQLVGQ